MIYYECDICSKRDMKDGHAIYMYDSTGEVTSINYHLCDACAGSIIKFINKSIQSKNIRLAAKNVNSRVSKLQKDVNDASTALFKPNRLHKKLSRKKVR